VELRNYLQIQIQNSALVWLLPIVNHSNQQSEIDKMKAKLEELKKQNLFLNHKNQDYES